jgi:hypothetical protein
MADVSPVVRAAAAAAPSARERQATHDGDIIARLLAAGVPAEPLALALRAVVCGRARGELASPMLTLVDFTRPSDERRLWVLDLERGEVRFHELVTHGRESGLRESTRFSNVPASKQSSLGLFRTGETYVGRHGYSLRLDGLEPGTNHLARDRAIVMHAADYATPAFAAQHGRLGRSHGCPALDPAVHRDVIDAIRGGTALFAYYPEPRWLATSQVLRCDTVASRVSNDTARSEPASLSRLIPSQGERGP